MENDQKQQEYLTNMQLETLSTGMRSYHSYGEYKIIINSDSLFENIVWNNANNRTKYVMQNQVLIQKIINRLKMNDYGLQSSFIKCVTTLHILDPISHITVITIDQFEMCVIMCICMLIV